MVADRVMSAADAERLPQPVTESSTPTERGSVATAPSAVRAALNSSGQPLPAGTRALFEPVFGHEFSQVRVHTDEQANQSARNLNALAYTVGHDIVFAAGQFAPASSAGKRLLVHELAHVVQQANGLQPVIQRQGGDEELCKDGVGKRKIGDVLKLLGTISADPKEVGIAQVVLRGKEDRHSEIAHVGDWLLDEWEIVEITDRVTVINATCGTEETLTMEAGTRNTQKPMTPPPETSARVSNSNFGPGTVNIYDQCKRVTFEPDDKSKEPRTYVLETKKQPGLPEMTVYVSQDDKKIPYPPNDLAAMLKVYLLGEKCGTPFPQETKQSEELSQPEDE